MDDYINRDIVLDIINTVNDTGGFTGYADYSVLFDEIDTMPAADVQPVPQWISVKDRLPETGKSVLIYYPKWDGDEIQAAKLDGDGMMFDICGEFNIGTGVVTHWMPLPEPPKDGDAE